MSFPQLRCCVSGCDHAAVTIIRGCSLCERCWHAADEIPDYVPSRYFDSILMELLDPNVTGSDSLEYALAKRGLALRPPRPPRPRP